MDELELLVFKEFLEGKIQADKLELDKRGFYKIGRFQMKQLQIIGKKILNELDKKDKEIEELKQEIKEVMRKDRNCLTFGYHSAYVELLDDLINIIEEE